MVFFYFLDDVQLPQPVDENEAIDSNDDDEVIGDEEIGEPEVDTRLRITDVLSMFACGLVTLQPSLKEENMLIDIE